MGIVVQSDGGQVDDVCVGVEWRCLHLSIEVPMTKAGGPGGCVGAAALGCAMDDGTENRATTRDGMAEWMPRLGRLSSLGWSGGWWWWVLSAQCSLLASETASLRL